MSAVSIPPKSLSNPLSILVVSPGHPYETTGGTETIAYHLFLAFNRRPDLKAVFLYPRNASGRYERPIIQPNSIGPNEYSFPHRYGKSYFTSYTFFDDMRTFDLSYAHSIYKFVSELSPNIIHFHHYHQVGLELMELCRDAAPTALLCLTLHDYKMICPNNGHLIRSSSAPPQLLSETLCSDPSLSHCTKCCSRKAGPIALEARRQRFKKFLQNIDLLITPSQFAREMYITWGVPTTDIRYIPNSMPARNLPPTPEKYPTKIRNVFGFFSRQSPYKGLSVLLDAAQRLNKTAKSSGIVFHINSEVSLLTRLKFAMQFLHPRNVRVQWNGAYPHTSMSNRYFAVDWVIVPSVWWENAPLVILEALAHGRPVICSNIGGMKELVRNGENGLLFDAGNPIALATVISEAVSKPSLWSHLVQNTHTVRNIDQMASETLAAYQELYN